MRIDPETTGRLLIVVALGMSIALVFATSGTPSDEVTHADTEVLELEPAGDGSFVQVEQPTGELRIVLAKDNPNVNGEGLNDEAATDVGPVFIIQNVRERQWKATVWIEYDSDSVDFYDAQSGVRIDDKDAAVELQPGDAIAVGLRVDTHGVEEISLSEITVKATLDRHTEISGGDGGSSQTRDSPSRSNGKNDTQIGTPRETPAKSSPSSATATPTLDETDEATVDGVVETAEGDSATSSDQSQETAGMYLDSTVAVILGILISSISACALLARRFGYV